MNKINRKDLKLLSDFEEEYTVFYKKVMKSIKKKLKNEPFSNEDRELVKYYLSLIKAMGGIL